MYEVSEGLACEKITLSKKLEKLVKEEIAKIEKEQANLNKYRYKEIQEVGWVEEKSMNAVKENLKSGRSEKEREGSIYTRFKRPSH